MSQTELAEKLGIPRSTVANWESGITQPRKTSREKLYRLGFGSDVGPPSIPASMGVVPVPYIGYVSASAPADWRDPDLTEDFEDVPGAWDTRGTFTCRVDTDSMYPTIYPGDLLMFKRDPVPRIGLIILFRCIDGRVTVKQLKHDGRTYVLHPVNPSYSDSIAEGEVVGFLVGIVRTEGLMTLTIYSQNGIKS